MKQHFLNTLSYLGYWGINCKSKERRRPFWAWCCKHQALGGIDPLANHMRSKLMQPAKEFHVTGHIFVPGLNAKFETFPTNEIDFEFLENELLECDFAFKHSAKSGQSMQFGTPIFIKYIPLVEFIKLDLPCEILGKKLQRIFNIGDIKNIILSNPLMKGELIDLRTASSWKFRTLNPSHSDDLFWKIFDPSKVKTQFLDDLLTVIRDKCIEHDDPNTDPVYGKREEIHSILSQSYRTYKQRVIHIDEIQKQYPGVDPITVSEEIGLVTIKRGINALKKR